MAIDSGKLWEFRICGVVPPGANENEWAGVVVSNISPTCFLSQTMKGSTIYFHDALQTTPEQVLGLAPRLKLSLQ